MILDAHAHIMSEVRGSIGAGATRSLANGNVQIGDSQTIRLMPPQSGKTTFAPEVLLENMDWAGVDKAVLLQGPFYGDHNQYVAEAVQMWPHRFIGAGLLDPRSSDAKEIFHRITDEWKFPIIKLELSEASGLCGLYPDLRVDEDALSWLWQEAENRGLVMTLDLGAVGSTAYQTAGVKRILERHPNLKIVIAHLAQPPISRAQDDEAHRLWEEQVLLARHPNVWFDLSSLPFYAIGDEYPFPSTQRYLQRAVELVGAEKLMWGTDAPALLCYATYPQLLHTTTQHLDYLSSYDLGNILGATAQRVYGEAS